MIGYRISALAVAVVAAVSGAAVAAAENGTTRIAWVERFQDSRQGPEQTDRFSGTYTVGGSGALDLNHIAGDVRVTTGRGNQIRVEAVKRVRHRDADEARRLLNLLRVEATVAGDRLQIRTVYPRSNSRSLSASVDYTITVPAGAAVNVKTISGDVSVSGARGEVRAESVSGDIDVSDVPNLVLAKAISGDVRAREINTQTPVTLSTVSGTVIANGLRVRTLEAGSVSGDVQLAQLQVERLTAKTVSGGIEFSGGLQRGGRYEFNAHSGDVRVALPGNTAGFELDSSTFSGSVRSDFPITLHTTSERGSRSMNSRAIRGTYGDSSAILSVRSFSGTVVITKR